MFKKVLGICLVLAVALCACISVSAADHDVFVVDFSEDENWTFMETTDAEAAVAVDNGALKITMGKQGTFNGYVSAAQECKDFTAEFKVTFPNNTESGGIPTAFFAYHAKGEETLNDLYLLTITSNQATAPGKLFVKNIGISENRAGYWAIPVKDVPFDASEAVINGTVALKVKFVVEGRIGKVYVGEGDGAYGEEPVTTLTCNADGIGMIDEIPGVDYTHLDIADALDVAGKFGFYANGQGMADTDKGHVITFSDVKITCTDGGAADDDDGDGDGDGAGAGEDSPATGVAAPVAALIALASAAVVLTASKKRA